MAINVTNANNQANQLSSYASQLRTTKSQLLSYKSSISANWQGAEVHFITLGIDQTIAQIDSAINELESLSSGVKSTAATIKREDDAAAAAARARAEKQQRINIAQNAYNSACNELDDLNKDKVNLEAKIKKAFGSSRTKLMKQLKELEGKIDSANRKCDACRNALNAAKR